MLLALLVVAMVCFTVANAGETDDQEEGLTEHNFLNAAQKAKTQKREQESAKRVMDTMVSHNASLNGDARTVPSTKMAYISLSAMVGFTLIFAVA